MEVTKIGTKNHAYFAPLLFEKKDPPQDGLVRIGVIEDGIACGAACFQVEEMTAQLVSVYVLEEYRRRGAATMLFDTFCGLAQKKNIDVLTVSFLGDNEQLRGFLAARDFQMFDSVAVYAFQFSDVFGAKELLSDMQRALQKRKDNWLKLVSYAQMQSYQQMEFARYLNNNGFGSRWLQEDEFAPELSFVVLDVKKQITAFVICSEYTDRVSIDLLYSADKNTSAVLLLFAGLYGVLKERGKQELTITYLAENPQMETIGRRMFGEHLRQTGCLCFAIGFIETFSEKREE